MLHRAKVLGKIRELGLTPNSLTWRKPDGTLVNGVTGLANGADENTAVIYPAEDLSRLFLEEVNKQPGVTVHWSHKVVSAGQNEASAWVNVEGGGRLEADFVVGCDGASSAVRKSLFGQNFPGKTWDKIIMGTNVSYIQITPQSNYTKLTFAAASLRLQKVWLGRYIMDYPPRTFRCLLPNHSGRCMACVIRGKPEPFS